QCSDFRISYDFGWRVPWLHRLCERAPEYGQSITIPAGQRRLRKRVLWKQRGAWKASRLTGEGAGLRNRCASQLLVSPFARPPLGLNLWAVLHFQGGARGSARLDNSKNCL